MQVPRALLNSFMPQKIQWVPQLSLSFGDLGWAPHSRPLWVPDSAELKFLANRLQDGLDPTVGTVMFKLV